MKNIITITLLTILSLTAKAQWNADTNVRTIVCNAAALQYQPRICSDGNKGAIICWTDQRGTQPEIYAQHIDSTGFSLWATNGVIISDATGGSYSNAEIASDGTGGAYIVYSKDSAFSLTHTFVTRINANGNPVWSQPLAIDVAKDSRNPKITSDGNGGAIINWSAYPGPGIFVQWVDASGTIHLQANGMLVSNTNHSHYHSRVAHAGDSTAYISYYDSDTLRVMRFDSTGNFSWATPTTLTNTFDQFENNYSITCNANHNAVVCWNDLRLNTPGIYAQSVSTSGNKLWTSTGKLIDSLVVSVNKISSANDGSNGTYIAIGSSEIKVQHLNQNGQGLATSTQSVCTNGGQSSPVILKNNSTGALVAWQDTRGNVGVYAQLMQSTCNLQWQNCGVPVYTNNNSGVNNDMHAITNNNGTGIAVFINASDIACAKIENNLNTGVLQLTDVNKISIYPNPTINEFTISFPNSKHDFMYRIYNATGKLILKNTCNEKETKVSVAGWAPGIYFAEIVSDENVETQKIIVQ